VPPTTPAPPTTVAVTGLCTLVDAGDLEALFGTGMAFGAAESTDMKCN